MAGVKVTSTQFVKTFSKEMTSRVLVDFGSSGKRQVLNREFDRALEASVDSLVKDTLPFADSLARQHYKDSYDLVAEVLKDGLRANDTIDLGDQEQFVSFHPLNSKYKLRKARLRPRTAELFWLFTGDMARAYRKFAGARKSSISRVRSTYKVVSRGYKYRGRTYRYQVDFKYPEIKQSQDLDSIFRKSYTSGSLVYPNNTTLLSGDEGTANAGMDVLAFNETPGHYRSRPFITRLMALRGQSVRKLLARSIQNNWKG